MTARGFELRKYMMKGEVSPTLELGVRWEVDVEEGEQEDVIRDLQRLSAKCSGHPNSDISEMVCEDVIRDLQRFVATNWLAYFNRASLLNRPSVLGEYDFDFNDHEPSQELREEVRRLSAEAVTQELGKFRVLVKVNLDFDVVRTYRDQQGDLLDEVVIYRNDEDLSYDLLLDLGGADGVEDRVAA